MQIIRHVTIAYHAAGTCCRDTQLDCFGDDLDLKNPLYLVILLRWSCLTLIRVGKRLALAVVVWDFATVSIDTLGQWKIQRYRDLKLCQGFGESILLVHSHGELTVSVHSSSSWWRRSVTPDLTTARFREVKEHSFPSCESSLKLFYLYQVRR